jgi:hypothetical protein
MGLKPAAEADILTIPIAQRRFFRQCRSTKGGAIKFPICDEPELHTARQMEANGWLVVSNRAVFRTSAMAIKLNHRFRWDPDSIMAFSQADDSLEAADSPTRRSKGALQPSTRPRGARREE